VAILGWQPQARCGRTDTATAQTQRGSIYSGDKQPMPGLVNTDPNATDPWVGFGAAKSDWGRSTRHIQGGWRAIVTQGARIACRSGRLRFIKPKWLPSWWTLLTWPMLDGISLSARIARAPQLLRQREEACALDG